MAFPDDLSDVAAFKVHPAIGVARLANNDDYYEFFDYEDKRRTGQAQDLRYMSVQNGNHWMMRQAVQFKVFAYDTGGGELGELSQDAMEQLGLQATWVASVANRKLNNWSSGSTPVVEAEASARSGQRGRLEGANPWRPHLKVWLGEITGEGLFVPPKGGAYRQSDDKKIPPYGDHERDNGILDTTSDGSITVELDGAGGVPVVPACIVVAPQQHSPDVNPGDIDNATNMDFVKETRELLGIPRNGQLHGVGYEMDEAMMKTINAEYNPGMEVSLQATNALPNPADAFYPRGEGNIDENEIRPQFGAGVEHGALTAGLCSTWQTDLNACLSYWTAEFPAELVHQEDPTERHLARKQFATRGSRMDDPEDLNAYIDMMGVGRNVEDDIYNLHGTERDGNDDAGAQPTAPFPLEPPK